MADLYFRRLTVEPFEGRVLPSRPAGPGHPSFGPDHVSGPMRFDRIDVRTPDAGRSETRGEWDDFGRRPGGPTGPDPIRTASDGGRSGPGGRSDSFDRKVSLDRLVEGTSGESPVSASTAGIGPAFARGAVEPFAAQSAPELRAALAGSPPVPFGPPPAGGSPEGPPPANAAFARMRVAPVAGSRTVWETSPAAPSSPNATPQSGQEPSATDAGVAGPPLPRTDSHDPQRGGPVAPPPPTATTELPAPAAENAVPATPSGDAEVPPEPPTAAGVLQAVVDQITFLAVPLAGDWPLDPTAVAGGAAELLGHLTDLGADPPADAFDADSSVWLGGVALTAGAAGYGLFLRPPRPRPLTGRPGADSVLARWGSHDAHR